MLFYCNSFYLFYWSKYFYVFLSDFSNFFCSLSEESCIKDAKNSNIIKILIDFKDIFDPKNKKINIKYFNVNYSIYKNSIK